MKCFSTMFGAVIVAGMVFGAAAVVRGEQYLLYPHAYYGHRELGCGGSYHYSPHYYRPYHHAHAYRRPYYIPPLYIPAEQLYGPQAVKRFFGWDQRRPPVQNINVIVQPTDNDDRLIEQAEEKQWKAEQANERLLERAWKYIGYGDVHFSRQKYADALQRYRKAVRAAGDLGEGFFRQGYALAAMGRYDLATRAIKRGLELDPSWPASDFRNDELFGNDRQAKQARLEAMAAAAEKNADDGDLLFLLGVHLHFDGQSDRAAVFFERAAQLAGRDDAHLRAFAE